jgi:hypothetical protein
MGHILPLTEFLCEVLLRIWRLASPDPCELLVALNCFLISLASLCFPQAQLILCTWIQSPCLLLAFHWWQNNKPSQEIFGEQAECESSVYRFMLWFFLVFNRSSFHSIFLSTFFSYFLFFLVSTLYNSNYDIIFNPSSFQCKILSCQTVKCTYPTYSSDVNNETCM